MSQHSPTPKDNTHFNPHFVAHRALFKAYDIRGNRDLFDLPFIWALALGFVKQYQEFYSTSHLPQSPPIRIALGYDARILSPTIAQIFADTLNQFGIHVIWLGLVTTPILAYVANNHSDGNGIMITASHSAFNICGIKWLIHYRSPTSDDIVALYHTLTPTPTGRHSSPPLPTTDYINQYSQDLLTVYKQLGGKRFDTLVIDCLNGATAVVVRPIFNELAQKVLFLNAVPDGNFPKGNPDPAEPHRLDELQQAVLDNKADLGLAFDGDGDRLAVVDSQGRVVGFDVLIYLLSLAIKATSTIKNPQVIFDIKCNHSLPNLLTQQGIRPKISQTGSVHLRRQLQQDDSNHIIFAGELSGHFIVNDGRFNCYDDGIYSATRLLAWLSHTKPLQTLVDDLPQVVATPDLYINVPATLGTPRQFIAQLTQHMQNHPPMGATLTTLDGVRLDTATSFGLMRASNTSDQLTVRFSGDTLAIFNTMIDDFCHAIQTAIHHDDTKPFCLTIKQIANELASRY